LYTDERKALRSTLFLSIVFLCVSALSAYSSGEKNEPPVESQQATSAVPHYSLQNVTHYHYEMGVLRVKIVFEKGDFFSELNELHVENCSFVYYDSSGGSLSRGQSKRAVLYQNQSQLMAEDDVVVISDINGGRLDTDYLEWQGDRNQFSTESFVTITRENGDILQGIGMVADVALRYVNIKKNVRGSIKAE